jgi:hypothetical protein
VMFEWLLCIMPFTAYNLTISPSSTVLMTLMI